MIFSKKELILTLSTISAMLVYFLLATPIMMDDGAHYQGFAEALARGKLDFKSFYGFQGLSFFAVPVFWITGSANAIIITSAIFSLLSIPLAYMVGKEYYGSKKAGASFLALFLLVPYPYVTMMRGFQEAALLFFILLIIYAAIAKKVWSPLAWAVGGIVKPFAITLFPLFIKDFISRRKIIWLIGGLIVGVLYLGANYYQTGHFINNAAINSYQVGQFEVGNPPPLDESFIIGTKGYLRVGANLLLHFRKIMLSPFIIVLGALSILWNKDLKLRKEIMLAIILNLILVGSLTFSFSKYLLPMATLFALASVSYLLKHRWLMLVVLADSFFVFLPIWNYFGKEFWSDFYIYMIPFWVAAILFLHGLFQKHRSHPSS